MAILIKNATIVNPGGKDYPEKMDLLIEDGEISRIDKNITAKNAQLLEINNLHLSPGWIDIGTQAGEPGYEQRETLETLAAAAVKGGFTKLVLAPNTDPVIMRRAEIDSLIKKGESLAVSILPTGAATAECKGKDLNEYMDMGSSGAVAFTDGRNGLRDPGCLSRCLMYAESAGKPIINRPLQMSFNPFGVIHEGKVSVSLGLEGIATEAEAIALHQDLMVLSYSGGRLISLGISSEKAIKTLSANDSNHFAGVAAMNLLYTDDALKDFDTAFKVLPPLREEGDRKALIKAIQSGKIKFIFSNHDPMESELKDVEFGAAAFGASTLETAFQMSWTALKEKINLEDVISLFTSGPAEALGMETPQIKEGEIADMCFFNPEGEEIVLRENIHSLSKAVPALNSELKGKVFGTLIGAKLNLVH
ncbi:MAG: hypothetical protein EA362_05435 [Saprospirales bacterium]|nr:MAG: hypothetical protein EA362_05435 [Saprospirales bacterium]